jgi:hypothetical protein
MEYRIIAIFMVCFLIMNTDAAYTNTVNPRNVITLGHGNNAGNERQTPVSLL